MPILADLTMYDAQATPVLHTFYVTDRGAIIEWTDRSTATPVGWNRITFSMKKMRDGKRQAIYKLYSPVTETPSGGLMKVVDVLKSTYTVDIPERAGDQLRLDHWTFLKGLANSNNLRDIIRYGANYSGT